MPTIADRPLWQGGKSSRWSAAVTAATIIAIPVWLGPVGLGACALMQDWPPPEAAGTNPPRVEPAPSPINSAPIASGPIVLAPSMTGAPAPPPAAAHTAAPVPPPSHPLPPPAMPTAAAATPVPPPAPAIPVAMPAPPSALAPPPAATVDLPAIVPITCPPGAVAMWSQPDAAGVPVPICRLLQPQR